MLQNHLSLTSHPFSVPLSQDRGGLLELLDGGEDVLLYIWTRHRILFYVWLVPSDSALCILCSLIISRNLLFGVRLPLLLLCLRTRLPLLFRPPTVGQCPPAPGTLTAVTLTPLPLI